MASESGWWLSFSVSIRCMAKELLPVIGGNHTQLRLFLDWKVGGLPPHIPSTTCWAYSLQGLVQTRLSLCEDLPSQGETDFEVCTAKLLLHFTSADGEVQLPLGSMKWLTSLWGSLKFFLTGPVSSFILAPPIGITRVTNSAWLYPSIHSLMKIMDTGILPVPSEEWHFSRLTWICMQSP